MSKSFKNQWLPRPPLQRFEFSLSPMEPGNVLVALLLRQACATGAVTICLVPPFLKRPCASPPGRNLFVKFLSFKWKADPFHIQPLCIRLHTATPPFQKQQNSIFEPMDYVDFSSLKLPLEQAAFWEARPKNCSSHSHRDDCPNHPQCLGITSPLPTYVL